METAETIAGKRARRATGLYEDFINSHESQHPLANPHNTLLGSMAMRASIAFDPDMQGEGMEKVRNMLYGKFTILEKRAKIQEDETRSNTNYEFLG